MKLKIEKQTMINGLQNIQTIVSQRSSIPILSNVMLETCGDSLKITANSMDVSVQTIVNAKISKEGKTTIDGKRLFSIFREMSGVEIDMMVDDNYQTTLRSAASQFKLNGMSCEEFPRMPEIESDKNYSINQGVFKEMLQKTSYAASLDETRMALNGVLLSFKEGKLVVVATDGRRLALVEQEVEFPASMEMDIIIPPKTVNELMRTLESQGEGMLKITAEEKKVSFKFSNILIVSKLIDDKFPDYAQVIPESSEERVTIEREVLLAAIRRVALLTTEQSNSVKLCFTKNNIEIVTETPEIGEAKENVAIKYDGANVSIAFNPEFLIAPLKSIQSDEIYFEMTDEMNPGVIKTDVPFLYVIMPMRIT